MGLYGGAYTTNGCRSRKIKSSCYAFLCRIKIETVSEEVYLLDGCHSAKTFNPSYLVIVYKTLQRKWREKTTKLMYFLNFLYRLKSS